jgi:hypothetical protein
MLQKIAENGAQMNLDGYWVPIVTAGKGQDWSTILGRSYHSLSSHSCRYSTGHTTEDINQHRGTNVGPRRVEAGDDETEFPGDSDISRTVCAVGSVQRFD